MFPVWRRATALWANYVSRFRMDQHVPFAFRHEVVRGEWRTLLMLWVRKETKTNKSFVFSYLLHFPPHPNPLPYVFCVHSCVICSSILSSLLSHTSSTTILSPPLMLVSPRLLSSPITPTGPACLPTAVRGESLKAAALGLWRHMSTRQALAPRWWWSRGSSCPSPALHKDLLTSYQDR